jgi:hypothetical protein
VADADHKAVVLLHTQKLMNRNAAMDKNKSRELDRWMMDKTTNSPRNAIFKVKIAFFP